MRPGTELFWGQAEQLLARWQRLLVDEPERLIRETRLYLRWLNRLEPADDDSKIVRDALVEITLETMIEAVLRR